MFHTRSTRLLRPGVEIYVVTVAVVALVDAVDLASSARCSGNFACGLLVDFRPQPPSGVVDNQSLYPANSHVFPNFPPLRVVFPSPS